jgi:hypothetical protein
MQKMRAGKPPALWRRSLRAKRRDHARHASARAREAAAAAPRISQQPWIRCCWPGSSCRPSAVSGHRLRQWCALLLAAGARCGGARRGRGDSAAPGCAGGQGASERVCDRFRVVDRRRARDGRRSKPTPSIWWPPIRRFGRWAPACCRRCRKRPWPATRYADAFRMAGRRCRGFAPRRAAGHDLSLRPLGRTARWACERGFFSRALARGGATCGRSPNRILVEARRFVVDAHRAAA